jgi:hypothetical protein
VQWGNGPGLEQMRAIWALERPERANGSPRLRRRGRLARGDYIEAGHGPAPAGWHVAASEHDDGAAGDDRKRPAAFGEFPLGAGSGGVGDRFQYCPHCLGSVTPRG